MKWIMYAKKGDDERIFYDSSSGNIERSIVSPKLKIELNKAGSFSFTILPSHPMYDFFTKMKTYIRIMQDDFEVFRGRVLQIEDSTYKEREIECEGDLAYLIDSLQPPDKTTTSTNNSSTAASVSNNYYRNSATNYVDGLTYQNGIKNLSTAQRNSITSGYTVQTVMTPTVPKTGESNTRETIARHFSNYIDRHNNQVEIEKRFNVGNVTVTLKDNPTSGQDFDSTSYRTTKTAIDSDLVKYFGGYVMTRKTDGAVYIDYLKNPGSVSQQNITLGMNLIDLQKTSDSKEIFSRLVPIGDKGLTLAAINPQTSNWYIKNEAAETKYGIIYKVESFSGASTTSELNELAKTYMAANCKEDPIRFNIKAIDMNLLDGSVEVIRLGSTIRVVSDPHGVDESLTVMSIEYDIQSPDNNTYEIGDPAITLSQKAKNDKNTAAASTSRAGSRSSRAVDVLEAAGGIEDTINQHATSISFVADKMFSIEAEEIKMAAKLMALEADLIDIHSKVIKITSDNVEIVADSFKINNTLWISSDPDFDGAMAMFGEIRVYGDFHVGSKLYYSKMLGEEGEIITDGMLRGFHSIQADHYYFGGTPVEGSTGQWETPPDGDLLNAVCSFGTPTVSSGTVTIPYNTFASNNAGTIQFTVPVSSGGGGGGGGGGGSSDNAGTGPSSSEIANSGTWTRVSDGTTIRCAISPAGYKYEYMPVHYNGYYGYIMSKFINGTEAFNSPNGTCSYDGAFISYKDATATVSNWPTGTVDLSKHGSAGSTTVNLRKGDNGSSSGGGGGSTSNIVAEVSNNTAIMCSEDPDEYRYQYMPVKIGNNTGFMLSKYIYGTGAYISNYDFTGAPSPYNGTYNYTYNGTVKCTGTVYLYRVVPS